MKHFSNLTYKSGFKDGLPIGLGYLSVSFAFGVTASSLGIPLLISLLTSITNITSAGQLAGITVIASFGTIIELILTQLVINARYFLMSISLSQKLDDTFTLPQRLLCAAFVTDEIFAVASSKPQGFNAKYYAGLMTLPYIGWILGTLLGGLAGNFLPTTFSSALGIALYAMFIAIIIPPAIDNKGVACAIILSAILSCIFYYLPALKVVSTGLAYIICALISALIIALIFPVKEDNKEVANELS